jgi:CheY-like chemotaxis protein
MEVHILLVEDNRRDAALVQEALKESHISYVVEHAIDGEAALKSLYTAEVKPQLVLLDLNLPRKGGLDVLKEIKQDSTLRPIPVVVLTNSRSEDDVVLAYASYCNAYVRKPIGYSDLLVAMDRLSQFWFSCASLPKQPAPDLSLPPPSGGE